MKQTLCRMLILLVALSSACRSTQTGNQDEFDSPAKGVQSVEPMQSSKTVRVPEGFVLGVDVSSVPALERSGVVYRNFAGNEQDVFLTLSQNGVTHVRVRVWNDPYDNEGNGFGGGNCDLSNAIEIANRASACGMQMIVDFHLSDFWADPGKQMAPRAWADMDASQKADAIYAFVSDGLEQLTAAGAQIGIVQIGNEMNAGLCGETDWQSMSLLMQAGARAVRAVCPDAWIAMHFTNPERVGAYAHYAMQLQAYSIDYDVFATSYYPYWHGTLENLCAVLSDIADRYEKRVMVMETAYAYTSEDTDFFANTVGAQDACAGYPFTEQGQADMLAAVIDALSNHTKNGVGVVYWEGAWISVGGGSWEQNSKLWEQHGSGWATSYAKAYDPVDAGRYYGGCAVDNQALFDAYGNPLSALGVFAAEREKKAEP